MPADKPKRPAGRPSSVPPLCGLTAPEIARAIHGPDATPGQIRVAGYHLAGATAMGVDALDALLDARPDLDAREVVRELAARLRARRGAS